MGTEAGGAGRRWLPVGVVLVVGALVAAGGWAASHRDRNDAAAAVDVADALTDLLKRQNAVGVRIVTRGLLNNAKVDAEFFAGTEIRSNFLVNLGYGDASKLHPRGPRFNFDEVCKIA